MSTAPNTSRIALALTLASALVPGVLALVCARVYSSADRVLQAAVGAPELCQDWEPVGTIAPEERMFVAAPLGDRQIVVVGSRATQVFDVQTGESQIVSSPWSWATSAGFLPLPDGRTLIGVCDQPRGTQIGDVLAYLIPGDPPSTTRFRGVDVDVSLSLGLFGLYLLPDDQIAQVGDFGPIDLMKVGDVTWEIGPNPKTLSSGPTIMTASLLGPEHLLLVDTMRNAFLYDPSDGSLTLEPPLHQRPDPFTLTPFGDAAFALAGPSWEASTETVLIELDADGVTSRPGPPLIYPRDDARVLTLGDGSVLVGGGIGPDGELVAEYERLELGDDRFEPAGTACAPARVPLLAEVDGVVYRVGGGNPWYFQEESPFEPVGQVERWRGP